MAPQAIFSYRFLEVGRTSRCILSSLAHKAPQAIFFFRFLEAGPVIVRILSSPAKVGGRGSGVGLKVAS